MIKLECQFFYVLFGCTMFSVDLGFAIGSCTQLLYWEMLLMMKWKVTLLIFLTVVRFANLVKLHFLTLLLPHLFRYCGSFINYISVDYLLIFCKYNIAKTKSVVFCMPLYSVPFKCYIQNYV